MRLRAALGGAAFVGAAFALTFALWSRAAVADVRHACEVGRQRIYRVAFVTNDSSTPGAALGPRQANEAARAYKMRMSGTLAATDVACGPSETVQLWNVLQPQLTLDATENGPLFSAILQNDLVRPYAVRFDGSGRVLSVAYDPAAGEFGAGFMRRLISSMEVVVPNAPARASTSWHEREPDVAGERSSTYALRPWIEHRLDAATLALHRTTGVIIVPPDQGRFIRHVQTNGVGDDDVRWLASGELQSLAHSYAETTRVNARVVRRAQELIQVDRILAPRIDSRLDSSVDSYATNLLASANAAPLHVEATQREVDLQGFTTTLGKETAASLMRSLERIARSTTVRERATITTKLAALFYVQPASIDDFVALARRAPAESPQFLTVTEALSKVGTAQSQGAALSLLLGRENDQNAASEIVAILGLYERPIAKIDAVLEHFSDRSSESGRGAELALGTIARSVEKTDPERACRLVARIEHRLAIARVADRRHLELMALGNAGDVASVDLVERYVEDPDFTVRAAAAMALRHQSSSIADDTLRDMLSDARAGVRIAAASAFAERVPGDAAYSRLESLARSDPDSTVRSVATDAVWKTHGTRSDARDFVAEVAQNDREESVRAVARTDMASDETDDDDADRAPMDFLLSAAR